MDRKLIYPGSIPLDTDLLAVNRDTMIAIGYLAQALLGTSPVVDKDSFARLRHRHLYWHHRSGRDPSPSSLPLMPWRTGPWRPIRPRPW